MFNKLDGEKVVIFHLLKNSAYFYRIFNKIDKNVFKKPETQLIFENIQNYYKKFEKKPTMKELALFIVNSTLQKTQRDNVIDYFKTELAQEKEIENFDFLIDFTEKYFKKVSLTDAILESVEVLKTSEDLDNVDIISKFENALDYKFDTDLGLELTSELEERFKNYKETFAYIPTGIKSVDEFLGGGVRSGVGSLFVINSPSGNGKSGLMCAMSAGFTKQGKNGLYITLEMPETDILKRVDANILDTEMYKFNDMKWEDYKEKFDRVKNNLGKLFVKEYPAGSFSTFDLEKLKYDIEQENNLELDYIVVDYMGLMKSTRVKLSQGSYLFFKSVSEELHGFSKKHKVPLITAFQMGRCLDLNTIIKTKDGDKKLKDIKINDKLLSNDGYNKVTFISNIKKQKVFKIKTKSGKEIISSEIHKFPTPKGFISISEGLEVGDKLNTKGKNNGAN